MLVIDAAVPAMAATSFACFIASLFWVLHAFACSRLAVLELNTVSASFAAVWSFAETMSRVTTHARAALQR